MRISLSEEQLNFIRRILFSVPQDAIKDYFRIFRDRRKQRSDGKQHYSG